MRYEKLKVTLEKHKMWLNGLEGGERLDLRNADLRNADLSYANLCGANLSNANLYGATLRCANLCNADLSYADLSDADLRGASLCHANLRDANLSGADLYDANLSNSNLYGATLDFSCLPLWCGSLGVKVDKRISAQIAYHFCRLECDDPNYKAARNAILDFANTFHRVDECGKLEELAHD